MRHNFKDMSRRLKTQDTAASQRSRLSIETWTLVSLARSRKTSALRSLFRSQIQEKTWKAWSSRPFTLSRGWTRWTLSRHLVFERSKGPGLTGSVFPLITGLDTSEDLRGYPRMKACSKVCHENMSKRVKFPDLCLPNLGILDHQPRTTQTIARHFAGLRL